MLTLDEIEMLRVLNMAGLLRLPKFFQDMPKQDMQDLTLLRHKLFQLMEFYSTPKICSKSSIFFKSALRRYNGVEKFFGRGTKDFPYELKTKWGSGKFFNARLLFNNSEFPNYIEKKYCFSNCYFYAKNIGETNDKSCKVLSGIAYINKIAILHSVVEFENGWIMDFNYDLVMQKDLYFALFGFEVLSELTSQEIFVKDRLFNRYSQYIKSYGHGYRVFASDALLEYAESCANGDQSCRLAIGNF